MYALIFFVYYVFAPFVLVLGFIGDILAIKVLRHKDLENIGPRDMYYYLFLSDLFELLQIIVIYLQYTFDINLSTISDLSCRLWNYVFYTFATISLWLIVYISLDRCISIQRPAWRFTLRKIKNQFIWFILVIVVNIIYYIPVGFYFKGFSSNNTTNSHQIICDFANKDAVLLISYLDLAIRVILPFCLMFAFSLMLTNSLFKSRRRIVENFLPDENQTFYKEIRLALSSITMNIIYMITQLPVSITVFQSTSDLYYISTLYLFFIGYAINFYIVLATNSLFRTRFIKMIKNIE